MGLTYKNDTLTFDIERGFQLPKEMCFHLYQKIAYILIRMIKRK
jgi:hypothetical protein